MSLKTVFISIQGCSKTTFLEKEAQESTQSQTRPIYVPPLPYGGVDTVEACAERNSALPFPDKVQGNASDIEPSCATWPAKDEHQADGWKSMSHVQIGNKNLACLYKNVFARSKHIKLGLGCLTSQRKILHGRYGQIIILLSLVNLMKVAGHFINPTERRTSMVYCRLNLLGGR